MRTVSFHTLGCKLNFSETSLIAHSFRDAGWQRVDFQQPADATVINTCSVTENADRECRTIVHRALAANPQTFIIVTGCYAQLKPEEIASIPGVDLVVGANEKFNIQKHIDGLEKNSHGKVIACDISHVNTFISAHSAGDRTRVFLKVQDGCDYSCSFCTIPLARGKSRSDSIANVIHNARLIAEQGAKEIVLTGVNLGDFREGEKHFYHLIQELDSVEGVDRYRISSIEPNLLTDEIIRFVAASEKFVPHFHIPMQSGCDKTLKQMRRRYLRKLYADRAAMIKELMPHCCIGADVIVGFPGESEDDFLESYHFINELEISYLHVFTYSERDNTHAIKLMNAVPYAERKRRNRMLRILSEKKLRFFYQQQMGKTFSVLFEADCKEGMMYGFTENYVKVKTVFDPSLVNKIVNAKLVSIDEDNCVIAEFDFQNQFTQSVHLSAFQPFSIS